MGSNKIDFSLNETWEKLLSKEKCRKYKEENLLFQLIGINKFQPK